MLSRRGVRAVTMIVLIVSVATTACWKQKNLPKIRMEICAGIMDWFDRAIKICNAMTSPDLRNLCLVDASRKNDMLSSKKQEAIEAYIKCDKDAFTNALKAIKDIIKAVSLVTKANFDSPLGAEGKVAMVATATSKGVVSVDQFHNTVPKTSPVVLANGAVYSYDINAGSWVDIVAWDLNPQSSLLSGALQLTLAANGNGYAGSVQSLQLNFTLDGVPATLNLAANGQPSIATLNPDGSGLLQFHGSLNWGAFQDAVNWYELPIQASADLHTLTLAPQGVAGEVLFPQYDPTVKSRRIVRHVLGDTNLDGVVDGVDLANVFSAYTMTTQAYDVNFDGKVSRADLDLVLGALRAR